MDKSVQPLLLEEEGASLEAVKKAKGGETVKEEARMLGGPPKPPGAPSGLPVMYQTEDQ